MKLEDMHDCKKMIAQVQIYVNITTLRLEIIFQGFQFFNFQAESDSYIYV